MHYPEGDLLRSRSLIHGHWDGKNTSFHDGRFLFPSFPLMALPFISTVASFPPSPPDRVKNAQTWRIGNIRHTFACWFKVYGFMHQDKCIFFTFILFFTFFFSRQGGKPLSPSGSFFGSCSEPGSGCTVTKFMMSFSKQTTEFSVLRLSYLHVFSHLLFPQKW